MNSRNLLPLLALLSTVCAWGAEDLPNLSVKGSTTVGPAIRETVREALATRKFNVTVEEGGSAVGIKCAKESSCDVGMASKSVSGSDAEGLQVIHYGWDGLAFVAGKSVNVTNLTKEQIRKIFSGQIKNWKELGGKDLAITVFSRLPSYGESEMFEKEFQLKPTGEAIGSNEAVKNRVAATDGAVAFMSLGLALAVKDKLHVLSFEGHDATLDNVKTGSYPLRRELVLLVNPAKGKNPVVREFLDFVLAGRKRCFASMGFIAD